MARTMLSPLLALQRVASECRQANICQGLTMGDLIHASHRATSSPLRARASYRMSFTRDRFPSVSRKKPNNLLSDTYVAISNIA